MSAVELARLKRQGGYATMAVWDLEDARRELARKDREIAQIVRRMYP